MRGEFVDVAGARLYYYAAGSHGADAPVVLLHGFATSGHLWTDVVSLMSGRSRIVVADLLGYGRSDPPLGRPLTLQAHAARVAGLMDALDIRRACVAGHGLGGGVAHALALTHPDRVSHLALVNGIAFGEWPSRDVRIARAAMPALRHVPPAWLVSMVRAEVERGCDDAARVAHAIDKFLRPFTSSPGRDALCEHIMALDARETRAMGERLHEIAVPAAVVWGSRDPFLPVAVGRRLADSLCDATLEVIDGGRHMAPQDAPRDVADALGRLLSR